MAWLGTCASCWEIPYRASLLVPAFNYLWSAVALKHQVHRDHLLKRKGPHSLVTAMVFTALRYYCLLWFFISCCVGSMLKLNRSGWCSSRNNLSVGSDTLQGSKEKGFGRNSDTMLLYKYNNVYNMAFLGHKLRVPLKESWPQVVWPGICIE